MHPENYDPEPDPAAVVRYGNARFTLLTSRLLRMEWAEDERFEDRSSLVFLNRRTAVPDYRVEEIDGGIVIVTDHVELTYRPRGNGRFTSESLSATFDHHGTRAIWEFGREDPENLGGATRSLDYWQGGEVLTPPADKMYAANFEPIGPGLVSRSGWAVVDDSQGYLFDGSDFSFADGEQSSWPWVTSRPSGHRQDIYLLAYGDDYRAALGDYVRIAGRIPIPPRFTFGTWWSRYTVYSDQDVLDLTSAFRRNGVPLDVFVIDLEWHPAYHEQWLGGVTDQSGSGIGFGGHSWNRLLFPDPERFLEDMHRQGLKVTLNLHPSHGVQPHEDHYAAMAEAVGQDPTAEKWIPLDIADKTFAENYLKFMHHPIEDDGVDFWWLDHIRGDETSLPGLQNVWWMNYVYFTDMARRGKRPLIFHRWAGLGSHRYPIQFSGDIFSSWESLQFEIGFTSQSANVGAAYWSHDLGGHFPGEVEPELYARWIQFGLYSPVMRTHTSKNPRAERMIWAYPEPYAETMTEAFRQRHALLPYIYTEARRTYESGVAFIRPLYYDWPAEDEAYTNPQQYAFGDNLVVAPITTPMDPDGTARQTLWVPPGEWYDLTLGRHLSGPSLHTDPYLLDEIPVLQRAGSIVPLRSSEPGAIETLVLRVAPSVRDVATTYTIYEDDGSGRDYQVATGAETTVTARFAGNEITVSVQPVRGASLVALPQRLFGLILPGSVPPEDVSVNGASLSEAAPGETGWCYDGQNLTTTVTTGQPAPDDGLVICVRVPAGDPILGSGVTGALRRLRRAFSGLNETWPAGFAPDALIEAAQLGRRITLQPHRAAEEIEKMKNEIGRTQREVDRVRELFEERQDTLARRLSLAPDSPEFDEEFRAYEAQLRAAESLTAKAARLIG